LVFITPMIMVTVILLGVFALDGARLYSLRQEMQSQVNAAATAAADAAQACGGQSIDVQVIEDRALIAAHAQGFEGTSLDVQPGVIEDSDGDGNVTFRSLELSETPSAILESNAVLVKYDKTVPISILLPEGTFGSIEMAVSAAARKEAAITISAAGGTAGVNGGLLGALLGGVLGQSNYGLDPTSLESLRNTTVQLGEVIQVLDGVDTVTQLLGLSGAQLAEALSDLGAVSKPVASLLDSLAVAAGIETIRVSDVIEVVEKSSVPKNSELPIYDVVVSLVLNIAKQQQAGPDGLLALPLNVNTLSLPGLASVEANVSLNVGEPPTIAIGPARKGVDGRWLTEFHAPDITLYVDANVSALSLPGSGIGVADISLPLAVHVGGGRGELVSARCARGTHNDVLVGVNINRSVASIASGTLNPDGSLKLEPVTVDLLSIFSLPLVSVNVEIEGEVPGDSETVLMDPYPLYCSNSSGCARIESPDYGEGLGGLTLDIDVSDTTVLGLPLGSLLNPIVNGLTILLDKVIILLVEGLVNPLLETLGIGLGSISVAVSGADQNAIQLIENIEVE